MRRSTRLLLAASISLAALTPLFPPAATAAMAAEVSDQQQVVNDAVATIREMKQVPGFGRSGLLARAKAVLIVPHAYGGAIGIGAQAGQAVLLVQHHGRWSDPAFYQVGGVSLGVQLGGQETSRVLLIMSERALDKLLQDSNVSFGAQAGLTAVDYDVDKTAALGAADVVVWSKSRGAYAGAALNAAGFSQHEDYNQAYYGKRVTAAEIVRGAVHNPNAELLRAAL